MATAKNKTQPTKVSVQKFIAGIKNDQRRRDAKVLCALMAKVTGEKAVMWGPSIIGFGKVHYRYESGREGDMGAAGFSPRKSELVLYLVDGGAKYRELLARLGKHSSGKVCVYIKRLDDINMKVLEQLIRTSYRYVMARKDAMHKVL